MKRDVKIEDCRPSQRLHRVCNNHDIFWLSQLENYTWQEFRKFKGVGMTTLMEAAELMDDWGYKFKDDIFKDIP